MYFATFASLALLILPALSIPAPVPSDDFELGEPTRLVIVYPGNGGLYVTRTVILEPTSEPSPTPTTTKKPTWPPKKTITSTTKTPKKTPTKTEETGPIRTIILS